jgi:hypothetical protein
MSRKVFIIAIIVLVAIIVSAILIFRGKESPTPKQVSEERVDISRLPENWQLIKNTKYHYSLRIPPSWEARLIGDDIAANFKTDTFKADVVVNAYSNPENTNLQEWVESSKPSKVSEINKEGFQGLRYVGQELAEGYTGKEMRIGAIAESYAVGNIFKIENRIVDVRCSISGPNYKTMIPTCERIVESLQFRE